MPLQNSEIADAFNMIADLLEIRNENPFRIRAYRRAAQLVSGLAENISTMVERGDDLSMLPGIGKDLAAKITTLLQTGTLPILEEIKKSNFGELTTIMKIGGLGGKRVKKIHDELGVTTIDELEKAAVEGKIHDLPGFGKKIEQTILDGIEQVRHGQQRHLRSDVEGITESVVQRLRKAHNVKTVIAAGSFRRHKETVHDIDILAACRGKTDIMERFVAFDDVLKVAVKGDTRSSVILRPGLQADLRVVPEESYGAALHYFTGSKEHNIAVRTIGLKRGLTINEYGVFNSGRRIAGTTEEEVYATIGMPFIEPELRENRGEIESALKGTLPNLVTVEDIRGDLHMHTTYTDGKNSLTEMVQAARDHGYRYAAITDHSKHVAMAGGLDSVRLRAQLKEIDRLNATLKNFIILKGIEVDILEDGRLDLPDDVLRELDLTVCSIHYKFNLTSKQQTERILRAMDNRYFTILGHPTGRIINDRQPYQIDVERVLAAAKERGCIMEINGQPDRLDLNDFYCRSAKTAGVGCVLNTDAHFTHHLGFMRFAVAQARRGWLEPEDILNTRSSGDLLKLLKGRR